MVLPLMGTERRDIVSDGPLVILGCEGCPARQEGRGKGSGKAFERLVPGVSARRDVLAALITKATDLLVYLLEVHAAPSG